MSGSSNYEKNKRIAGNTVFLFIRMLLMMFIGLFTSRIILQTLGEHDFGVFNAVGGVVSFCAVLTGSVSSAITRFLTFSLGEGDPAKTHRVFSASVIIQLLMCLVVGLIVETAGLWWLNSHMSIPPDRLVAARWVLHCSFGILCVNLLSVPYNSMILAHEKMSAYAYISILESLLKLSVAILLMYSSFDKLKTYSLLMLVIAIIVRITYGIYCKRHFDESRGRIVVDKGIIKEMSGFVGWNFFSSGFGVMANSGTNLLINKYFGVLVNAARGLTTQVEGTVRPFAVNFLSALNPRLTKSYAEGDKKYVFDLVHKGVKISFLLLLLIVTPLFLECDYLLDLWLKDVPEYTSTFVRISLLCILADIGMNSPRQLIIASGRIKSFCVMAGIMNLCAFVAVWVIYALGGTPESSYIVFLVTQIIIDVLCLLICKWQEGFPILDFIRKVLIRLALVAVFAFLAGYGVRVMIPAGFLRLVAVTASTTLVIGLLSYFYALTKGERDFIEEIFYKIIRRARK
ncbi:MAG: lipopolysaccharide biosynthesis protein [Bacteroidales bacterium]|nr:lipopolysaccharide biosynthesis protein [Bacteroidales bacterium]